MPYETNFITFPAKSKVISPETFSSGTPRRSSRAVQGFGSEGISLRLPEFRAKSRERELHLHSEILFTIKVSITLRAHRMSQACKHCAMKKKKDRRKTAGP